MYINDLILEIGSKHRKLTIIKLDKTTPYTNYYLCKCDCGKEIILTSGQIHSRIGSCGCRSKPTLVSEEYKRLKSVWKGMMRRCYNKNHISYHRYGGRGIKVCERWQIFTNFFSDLHNDYKKGLQLDRIDNDGDYSLYNYRLVDRKKNMHNSIVVKLDEGKVYQIRKSNKTNIELGKMYNIDPSTISRIKNNQRWII